MTLQHMKCSCTTVLSWYLTFLAHVTVGQNGSHGISTRYVMVWLGMQLGHVVCEWNVVTSWFMFSPYGWTFVGNL